MEGWRRGRAGATGGRRARVHRAMEKDRLLECDRAFSVQVSQAVRWCPIVIPGAGQYALLRARYPLVRAAEPEPSYVGRHRRGGWHPAAALLAFCPYTR